MIEGSQPTTAIERIRARGVKPNDFALDSLIISIAEAPSDKADDVPAVTVPFTGSNAGRKAARPDRFVSGRMTSSKSKRFNTPSASCPLVATISLRNALPESQHKHVDENGMQTHLVTGG